MADSLDLDDLERIARAADDGIEWSVFIRSYGRTLDDTDYHLGFEIDGTVAADRGQFASGPVARHVATFDPPTVLRLVARIREAHAVLRECAEEIEYWHADMLTAEERSHPRGSGWAGVYDRISAALTGGDRDG